jgi:hypothetical protein
MKVCYVCLKPKEDDRFPKAGKNNKIKISKVDNVCSDCQPSTQVKKKRIKTKKKRGY